MIIVTLYRNIAIHTRPPNTNIPVTWNEYLSTPSLKTCLLHKLAIMQISAEYWGPNEITSLPPTNSIYSEIQACPSKEMGINKGKNLPDNPPPTVNLPKTGLVTRLKK